MPEDFFDCECRGDTGSACKLRVKINSEDYEAGKRIIVDDCPYGPSEGWTLEEKKDGYSIYRSLHVSRS